MELHLDLENNYFDFPVKYNKEVKSGFIILQDEGKTLALCRKG